MSTSREDLRELVGKSYPHGFVSDVDADTLPPGLDKETIRAISARKREPEFLLQWRLQAFQHWLTVKEPCWATVHHPPIDYQAISYYSTPKSRSEAHESLDDIESELLETYEKLGIPLAEQKRLAGIAVDAVFDSVSVATTFVQKLLKADYQPQRISCIGLLPEDIEHLFIADADVARAVFVNGWYSPQLSHLPAPASGIDIASLAQVLEQRPQQLQGQLGNTADNEAHGFSAMNTAALNDGLYLHVAEGAQADTAIHLLYLTTASDGLLSLPRNLIRLDAGARAVVIEHYASLGETRTLTDTVSEIVLGEDAALELYCLQMESMASSHIASQYVTQERGSKLTSTLVSLGGGLVRSDLTTRLTGCRAESRLNSLYIATGQQHMDFHTCIDHTAARCTSRQNYRGGPGQQSPGCVQRPGGRGAGCSAKRCPPEK